MLPAPYRFLTLSEDDAAPIAAAYDRNRDHLGRWDPTRAPSYYTPEGQAEVIASQLDARDRGLFDLWVLWHGDDVVGRGNIQNIVRGSMQGGTLGYWVDRDHLRRGLARAMVDLLVERALDLGLHRLEAGTMVENEASQAVLRSAGFEQYGVVPQFLFLGGAWRDHVLFQRILHDRPLVAG